LRTEEPKMLYKHCPSIMYLIFFAIPLMTWHSCAYHDLLGKHHTSEHALYFSSNLKISVQNIY
jgi:hypothetical protein